MGLTTVQRYCVACDVTIWTIVVIVTLNIGVKQTISITKHYMIVRSFVRYCGQGSSLLWTPALRPLCRFNAPAQGEEVNW